MKPSIVFHFTLCLFLQAGLPLLGQQDVWLRDSVYLDRGIPETSDFDNIIRVYFEEYDQDGQPIEIISQKQNDLLQWQNWRRQTFEYQDGSVTNVLIEYWDLTNQEWQANVQRFFTYDGMGNRLTKVVQRAPTPGDPLQNKNQWLHSYNGDGNQTQMLYQGWIDANWEDISRQTWNYNTDSQLEQQLLELWSGSEWVNDRRRQWQYDGSSSQILSVTAQIYDGLNNEWMNSDRMEYSNDGQAFWTGAKHLIWNEATEEWDNLEREVFNYNQGAQLQYRILQQWEFGDWQNMYRLSYTSDSEGVAAFGDLWDEDNATWNIYSRYLVEYEDFSRPILEQGWQFWNDNFQTWENDTISFRRTHFWSEQSVGTSQTFLVESCLIPNPYQPFTSFVCETLPFGQTFELQLFSITGQELFHQKITGQGPHSIDLALPDGIYVVRIHDSGELLHLQKLVITN